MKVSLLKKHQKQLKKKMKLLQNITILHLWRLDYRYNANNTQTSSFWIKNGSYLRLKSVELGFTYKNLRAYLAGTNLFIISPFKYWDPEMGSGNGLKYPLQRVVKLGLQYNF